MSERRECCICNKSTEWREVRENGMTFQKSIQAHLTETPAGLVCQSCLAVTLNEIIERLTEWDPVLAREVIQYTIRRKRVLLWRRKAREVRMEARMQDQAADLRRMVEESDAQIRYDAREAYLEARAERQMWAGQS